MRISIYTTRVLSIIIPVVLGTTVLACGTSSTPEQPSPVTNAMQAEAQATPQAPADQDFETALEGNNLAKFKGLPSEFQDALRQEFEEAGEAKALGYLRDLPNETVPVVEALDPTALGWFRVLPPDNQRFLLLEGYPDVYRRNAQAGRDFDGFKFAYGKMVEVVFDNRGVNLPHIEDALSADAQTKLDSMAPPLARAFRFAWSGSKPLPIEADETVKRLEGQLLSVPVEMPAIEELGLSDTALAQFRALLPDVQEWLWKHVAYDLVARGRLSDYSVMRDEYIQVLSEPDALSTFNRGIMPVPENSHVGSTFACLGGPSTWPDSVAARMPQTFGDRLAVYLPPFEEVLSSEALTRLGQLDSKLRTAFEDRWNSSGPFSPRKALCEITKLERGIIYIPTTVAPTAESLLSQQGTALYETLSDESRKQLDRAIADSIIIGLAHDPRREEWLNSFSTPPDEFLDALGAEMEDRIKIWTGSRADS